MQFCVFAQTMDSPEDFGGRTWARTKDPLIKSQLLYQLSYASVSPAGAGPGEGVAYSGSAGRGNRFSLVERNVPWLIRAVRTGQG